MNENQVNKDHMIQSLSNQLTRSNLVNAELEAMVMTQNEKHIEYEEQIKDLESQLQAYREKDINEMNNE